MAAPAGVPKWLNDSKDHISTTKEWKSFTGELHQAIQQQLKESRVTKFADLTDAERSLFLERASKAIQNGQSYRDFYAKVSHSLDQHINNEVGRQLMEEFPLETKSDLVLDQAQEGAMALLRRWPDMKCKLRACFNQPLPGPIRQLAWRLYLENTKVRKVYTDLLATNPRAAISSLDLEISQKCDYLLKAEATFEEIKGSVGAFYGMKAVLSYHHCRKKTSVPLSDIEFMLVVPFVHVASNKMSRREPAPGKVVALVVEEYTTFMASRPGYMIDSGSEEHEKEMESFATKVSKYVKDRCPEVTTAISKAYVPDQEKIVSTEAGSQVALVDGMTRLIRPVIRSLFSGYLGIEALLYVWDQYVLGSDVSGFNDQLLPILTAVLLILQRDKLKDCTSPADLETTLKLESPKLKVHQFQQQIKLHYYDELTTILHQDDKAGMPVLDPTQAKYAPWTHWYSDRIPPRVGPADRHNARQERDVERDEQVAHQRAAEVRKRELEEGQRKEDYLKFIEQQEAARFNYERQRAQMEEMLQAERKRRIEAERNSQKEIERLREEMEELRRAKLQDKPKHDRDRNDRDRTLPTDKPNQNVDVGDRKTDRSKSDKPRSKKRKSDDPKSDEPRSDKPRSDRSKSDNPKSDPPKSDKPRSDQQKSDKSKYEKPRSDKPNSDQPKSDKPRSEQTKSEKPRSDKPKSNQPKSNTSQSKSDPSTSKRADKPKSTNYRYLVPPPPSAASAMPLAPNTRTPTPNRPPEEQTQEVILDFLQKVAYGFNIVAHGEGEQREELDRQSEENIRLHKEDIKHAQIEVFGRQLKPDEFERLPDDEKQESSKKMMEVVKRRMHERRQKELDNQRK